MDIFNEIKTIIFDFDGVIIDSMEVRDYGFRKIFEKYSENKVEELIKYHRENGGLSRFHKIKHFYNNIINSNIEDDDVMNYANKFSLIMRDELVKEKYLIKEWANFIRENKNKYTMHIASGSEEKELRYLCENLGISKYFNSIHGSPTHKNELVKQIIESNNYNKENIVLIGDSINDYEAARINNIKFIGYNNTELESLGDAYLESVLF